MRGKYRRRKRARIIRDGGELALLDRPLDAGYHDRVLDKPRRTVIDPHVTLGEIPHGRRLKDLPIVDIDEFDEFIAIKDAIEQALKMKRSKRKGTANLDENMRTLGFRRVFGDEMVPEQFEAIR